MTLIDRLNAASGYLARHWPLSIGEAVMSSAQGDRNPDTMNYYTTEHLRQTLKRERRGYCLIVWEQDKSLDEVLDLFDRTILHTTQARREREDAAKSYAAKAQKTQARQHVSSRPA